MSSTGTTQHQSLVKAVVDRLILAHLRHHRVRVANHAAVVAVLDHHQSRGRVVPPVVVLIKDSLT